MLDLTSRFTVLLHYIYFLLSRMFSSAYVLVRMNEGAGDDEGAMETFRTRFF